MGGRGRRKFFLSSNTPPLISLVHIQRTGYPRGWGPGQADTYMGQFPLHLEMRNHSLSGLALKDTKIGDKARLALGKRTHSIPSQGGSRRKRDRTGISNSAHLPGKRTGIKAIEASQAVPPLRSLKPPLATSAVLSRNYEEEAPKPLPLLL